MDDVETRLAELSARSKSNTHRLDKLEDLANAIHALGKDLAVMCSQLEQQGKTLTALTERVAALERVPAGRWDKVVSTGITAVVGALVGAALVLVGL